MSIEVRQVSKRFGQFQALQAVSLEIATGELVALLGPSGSGKTTLLRIIAGLEIPDSGTILFHGEDATARRVQDRRVGFVFQHYALFRHMTVFENVAFGLRVLPPSQRPAAAKIRERVMALLELIQLEWLAERYPAQLSGGQRQRVALARALAVEPRILLLDEPFGALDAKVRQELRRWLRRLHSELHVTGVFVTHDQEEALEVADRVVVTNAGRIEQVGTPEEVFHQPANEFVMNFLGQVNVFHGRVEGQKAIFNGLEIDYPHEPTQHSQPARAFVRPHEWEIDLLPTGSGALEARIVHINAAGPQVKMEVTTAAAEHLHLEISQDRHRELALIADQIVFIRPREVKVFLDAPAGK
ncbi:MAG: Sulfate/thiosulfate import ATP-binding protein CysA [Phycisphaerae bacterium]|nr:Sulfate/thiosulfate import ATP-binding protein CysA [Phycisphaerae bacterium]